MNRIPISPYRIAGDLVFTAGQIGIGKDSSIPADVGRQAELAIEALFAVLREAGSSPREVIKTTIVIVRPADFAEMNEVYGRHFSEPWPARTTIVAGLALPELLFEIEAVGRLA